MRMTNRDRRNWWIFLWLSLGSLLVSAFFGFRASGDTLRGVALGIASSLFIATPLLLFEVRGRRLAIQRRLQRLPFLLYFSARVVLYLVVIVIGLVGARLV